MSIFPERWMGRTIPTHNIPKTYTKDGKVYCTFTGKKIKKKKTKMKNKHLIETFYYALPNNGSQEGINSTTSRMEEAKICAEIADDYAIGFAEWCIESEGKNYNKYKYRNRKELLEIYKKEKQNESNFSR
jgi:hypothetical protein